ncbi:MAG: hypothetical protein R2795_24340 [Saprospiraceae bacterium]
MVHHGGGSYTLTVVAPVIANETGEQLLHAIRIQAVDDCGNSGTQVASFNMLDKKAPIPACIEGLAVTLSNITGDCTLTLDAADLVASSLYDCSGQGSPNNDGQLEVTSLAIYRTP